MSRNPSCYFDPERRTFHIIITTYGSRLQGSERGSHRHGTGPVAPSHNLENFHRQIMTDGETVFSSSVIRAVVRDAILTTCREKRWLVPALNVRTNHVHILITTSANENMSYVVGALKSGVVEALSEFPEFRGRKIWAEKSSVNWIRSPRYFQYAYRYVMNQ